MQVSDMSPELKAAMVALYGADTLATMSFPIPVADRQALWRLIATERHGPGFVDRHDLDEFLVENGSPNTVDLELNRVAGRGPDGFMFSSAYTPDMDDHDGTTLLEVDMAWVEFQKDNGAWRQYDISGLLLTYRPMMHWRWSSWIEGGRFVYGFVSVAAEWLCDPLEKVIYDTVDAHFDALYPGTPMARTAEARNRLYLLAGDRMSDIVNGFSVELEGGAAWAVRHDAEVVGENRCGVVLSNARALDAVRLGSFLADVAALPDGTAELDAIQLRAEAMMRDAVVRLIQSAPGAAAAP